MPYGVNATTNQTEGTPGGYQNDCLDCPAGYFCLNATIVPKECGVGFYTKPGQSVCQVCGYHQLSKLYQSGISNKYIYILFLDKSLPASHHY